MNVNVMNVTIGMNMSCWWRWGDERNSLRKTMNPIRPVGDEIDSDERSCPDVGNGVNENVMHVTIAGNMSLL